MRALFSRVVLSGVISLVLAGSPSECFGQFGPPAIPGLGGGMPAFSPSVTNSINRNAPPPSLGLFERDRQENNSSLKPKYSDALFARPLKQDVTGSLGGPLSVRRARDRKSGSQADDRRFALRIPPGLREVKKARRDALTAGNSVPPNTVPPGASAPASP
jgi:hypothetical protein